MAVTLCACGHRAASHDAPRGCRLCARELADHRYEPMHEPAIEYEETP